ncbi:hypothetical protein SAY87_020416 [Trapa incisa]|uniref:Uncharacterized protein n=1 Tax=Trapa incisa TaxID=236973 RepID=A0AAN7K9Y3_9MYRT|nr:hypothetical protein SAY87_020416 [Trapa incisa]
MGNSLRNCIACVLPCGALDLIRIVHLDGHVEEISRLITAAEFLQSHPGHFLSLSSSSSSHPGAVRRTILVLSSHSELKRGSIYFLLPSSSSSSSFPAQDSSKQQQQQHIQSCSRSSNKIGSADDRTSPPDHGTVPAPEQACSSSERGGDRKRRHSRTASWLPHLESITED